MHFHFAIWQDSFKEQTHGLQWQICKLDSWEDDSEPNVVVSTDCKVCYVDFKQSTIHKHISHNSEFMGKTFQAVQLTH